MSIARIVVGVCPRTTSDPRAALNQLRRDARTGRLARLCQETGIELLVAFGSATDADRPLPLPATLISRLA